MESLMKRLKLVSLFSNSSLEITFSNYHSDYKGEQLLADQNPGRLLLLRVRNIGTNNSSRSKLCINGVQNDWNHAPDQVRLRVNWHRKSYFLTFYSSSCCMWVYMGWYVPALILKRILLKRIKVEILEGKMLLVIFHVRTVPLNIHFAPTLH